MQHAATRDLLAYWMSLRHDGRIPERDAVEPGPIRHILADTFILGAASGLGHPFRLAGTRLCALFCRELRGESFVQLWGDDSRRRVDSLVSLAASETIGICAGLAGQSARGSLDLEMIILPLAIRGRTQTRFLGALVPLSIPYWIGSCPIGELTLGPMRFVGADHDMASEIPFRRLRPPMETEGSAPSPLAGAAGGKIRSGLVVYDGGRR